MFQSLLLRNWVLDAIAAANDVGIKGAARFGRLVFIVVLRMIMMTMLTISHAAAACSVVGCRRRNNV